MRVGFANEVSCGDIGWRVTIRRRLAERGTTDVLGILETCDETTFGVRNRAGELIAIARADIIASRVVRARKL